MSSQATQLAVLSAVSVGMWSAKKDQGMWFLIVPRRQLFVFIVEDATTVATGRAGKRRRFAPSTSTLLAQLGAQSPFRSDVHKEGGCAFAFEVSFENISGIEYSNALIRPGRLVLEAHNTRKREFANIDSAFAYYGGADGEATRASLETLFGDGSPFKEQRSSTPWDKAVAGGGGGDTDGGGGGGGSINGASPMNPGLPAPPLRRTKTNLLARLGSVVGASKTSKANSNNKINGTNSQLSLTKSPPPSSPSPAISATTSIITTTSTSNVTIGNVVGGASNHNNANEDEVTSAINSQFSFTDTATSSVTLISTIPSGSATTTAVGHLLEINTSRLSPNPQLLFPNPVRNQEGYSNSPNATASKNLNHALQPPFSSSSSSSPRNAICSTPAPAASNIYDFRLITVHWTDPQLPEILRPIIETNEGMLRLYESGLPTWATFFPRAGLYYRPWLRSFTWVLFYAFSFFSLAVGFYDLYKTLPGLQAVLSKMVAGMWLPPVAVLQWIEEHAQIRLSILLTYIFGKSEMFLYVVRMLGHVKRTFWESAGPLIATVAPPLQVLWSASIAPVAALLRTCSDFTSNVLLPPLQALSTAFILPITWLMTMMRHLVSAAGGGGSAVAATSPWLVRAIPTDTINTLRNSLAIPTRAANSVWRSMNQMVAAFARHRLTWYRRAQRWRVGMKKRIIGTFWLIIDAICVCCTWIWAILNLIVAAGKAGVARQRQEDKEKEEAEIQKKQDAAEKRASASSAIVENVVENKKDN